MSNVWRVCSPWLERAFEFCEEITMHNSPIDRDLDGGEPLTSQEFARYFRWPLIFILAAIVLGCLTYHYAPLIDAWRLGG